MTAKTFLTTTTALAAIIAVCPALAAQPSLDQRVRALEQLLGVPPVTNDNRTLEQRVRDLETTIRAQRAAGTAPAAQAVTQQATQAATQAAQQVTQENTERLDKLEMRVQDNEAANASRATRGMDAPTSTRSAPRSTRCSRESTRWTTSPKIRSGCASSSVRAPFRSREGDRTFCPSSRTWSTA